MIEDVWRELRPEAPLGGPTGPREVPGPPEARTRAVGPVLHLEDVGLEDGGEYVLEATNQEGTTTAKVFVNVLCEFRAIKPS